MTGRTLVVVILLRTLAALVTPALLVLFFYSGRIAAWLPSSTWFVVVFLCAVVAFLIGCEVIVRRWDRADVAHPPINAHFASSPRTRRRHERRRHHR